MKSDVEKVVEDSYFVIRRKSDGKYLCEYDYEGPGCPGCTVDTWKDSFLHNGAKCYLNEKHAKDSVFERRKENFKEELEVVEIKTEHTCSNRVDIFDSVQKMLDDFDKKTRWVIKGKPGTKYEGKSVGYCINDDEWISQSTFLFNEYDRAKERLDELYKDSYSKGVIGNFEICKVTKEELYGIYRRAQII